MTIPPRFQWLLEKGQGLFRQVKRTGPLVVLPFCEWPTATLLLWGTSVHLLLIGPVKTFYYLHRSSQSHAGLHCMLQY